MVKNMKKPLLLAAAFSYKNYFFRTNLYTQNPAAPMASRPQRNPRTFFIFLVSFQDFFCTSNMHFFAVILLYYSVNFAAIDKLRRLLDFGTNDNICEF